MSGERPLWVTPGDGPPYRVVLRSVRGGWEAEVDREGERWTFPIAAGVTSGLAWSGARPIRYHWDPAIGGLSVDGWTHELRVESDAVHRATELRLASSGVEAEAGVRAPMPGLVLVLEVAEGDPVDKGQGILIIEAMKMENEIRSPIAGVVRRLSVSAGDTVERDALLCVVDPRGNP
ncbi:MAG TPA: biotin/lipoyl-containing protein [Gemmatimonadota bacterium]|nr:biotin/lipoyl-containing protein [Gemmatimonadota bacterium]